MSSSLAMIKNMAIFINAVLQQGRKVGVEFQKKIQGVQDELKMYGTDYKTLFNIQSYVKNVCRTKRMDIIYYIKK